MDPVLLGQKFTQLLSSPRSPPDTPISKFETPGVSCPRLRRWLWWLALAEIGIRMKELYAFTPWEHLTNSTSAIGTSSQEVARTPYGTITWMISAKRLCSPNGGAELLQRIRVGFPPLDLVADVFVTGGRKVPKQVAEALASAQLQVFRR